MKRQAAQMIGLFGVLALGSVCAEAQEREIRGQYSVDPAHSSVVFRAKHLGVSWVYGRFNEFKGSFRYDADTPSESRFELTIRAQSVDTGVDKRDAHLRSPDFFNARQFPLIRFQSTEVKQVEQGHLKVTGDLKLHGQTNEITVDVKLVGHGHRGKQFGYRAGWHTEFTIQRSNFGMDYLLENNGVGDEIHLMVGLEGQKQ